MTNDALIARLEAATEGSRELDAGIGLAVGDWKVRGHAIGVRQNDREYRWVAFHQSEAYDYAGAIHVIRDCLSLRPYTTSFDAALPLVPDGYRLYSLSDQLDDRRGRWFAGVANDIPPIVNPPATSYMGHAPTPALALCIAALKARGVKP